MRDMKDSFQSSVDHRQQDISGYTIRSIHKLFKSSIDVSILQLK